MIGCAEPRSAYLAMGTIRAIAHPLALWLVLWDSWMHPETRLQLTTWTMILHVLHFGACADITRRFLAPLSFLAAHGVVAGWLVFTYYNPELDRQEKVDAWGCSVTYGVLRTIAMHVMPLVVSWAILLEERAEWQRLFGSGTLGGALLKHAVLKGVPWFVGYGMLGAGALGMPGFQLIPDMVTQYKLPCTIKEVEDLQALVLIPTIVVAFLIWWRLVKAPKPKPKGKGKAA